MCTLLGLNVETGSGVGEGCDDGGGECDGAPDGTGDGVTDGAPDGTLDGIGDGELSGGGPGARTIGNVDAPPEEHAVTTRHRMTATAGLRT